MGIPARDPDSHCRGIRREARRVGRRGSHQGRATSACGENRQVRFHIVVPKEKVLAFGTPVPGSPSWTLGERPIAGTPTSSATTPPRSFARSSASRPPASSSATAAQPSPRSTLRRMRGRQWTSSTAWAETWVRFLPSPVNGLQSPSQAARRPAANRLRAFRISRQNKDLCALDRPSLAPNRVTWPTRQTPRNRPKPSQSLRIA